MRHVSFICGPLRGSLPLSLTDRAWWHVKWGPHFGCSASQLRCQLVLATTPLCLPPPSYQMRHSIIPYQLIFKLSPNIKYRKVRKLNFFFPFWHYSQRGIYDEVQLLLNVEWKLWKFMLYLWKRYYWFIPFFYSKSNPILFPFSKLLFIQKRKIDSKIMAF